MVRIIDLSDSDLETDSEQEGEVEEEEDLLPDPPEPPDPSSPQNAIPNEAAAPSSESAEDEESRASGIVSPIVRLGINPQYIWFLLSQLGHCIELNRSIECGQEQLMLPEGLNRWAAEIQRLAGPPNGHDDHSCEQRFTLNFERARSPTDGRQAEREGTRASATESSYTQTTDEVVEKEEGSKIKSDDSTKEKGKEIGDKDHLAVATAAAKAGLLYSPEISDCELSDVSDCLAPPDYDTIHHEQNEGSSTPTALIDCPWTRDPNSCFVVDVDPDLTESAGKEPSEASDEGEAAALPTGCVKDSWEEWMTDDRLFVTPNADDAVPSTSSAPVESIPSPATERRRIKLENRKRARQSKIGTAVKRLIFVPTDKIGRIVGKGGKRIKEIEKKTGAKIKIENRRSSDPVTQVALTGTNEEITAADIEISIIIRNFKNPKNGEPVRASVTNYDDAEELRRILLGITNQVLDGEKRCRKPEK